MRLSDLEPVRTLAAARRLPLLTNSAAGTFQDCNRLYFLSYEQGFRPAYEDPKVRGGKLGHRGLETWFGMARITQDKAAWLDAALSSIAAHESDLYDRARAEALMFGYHIRWSDAPLTVLDVEAEFAGELLNPATGAPSRTWRRGGKIDLMAREAGEDVVVEHKFTSEDITEGSDYWQRLTLDTQISNYLVGARLLGYKPARCIYDVIKRPAQLPLKATPLDAQKWTKPTKSDPVPRLYANQRAADETPDEYRTRIAEAIAAAPNAYYYRRSIVRLAEEEREAAFDAWSTGVQIRESRRAGIWPRNTHSCRRYGRSCDFLPVCLGTARLTDGTRYRRAERANEELGSSDVEVDSGDRRTA